MAAWRRIAGGLPMSSMAWVRSAMTHCTFGRVVIARRANHNRRNRTDRLACSSRLFDAGSRARRVRSNEGHWMLTPQEWEALDAIGIATLVKEGEVSGREMVETAIARIEQLNPMVNAVVYRA